MNLQKFGKLIKVHYGSVGGELLNDLYSFYCSNKKEFEQIFCVLELNGTKGCFLYDNKIDSRQALIVFGTKFVDLHNNTISFEGKVMARGEFSEYKIGDEIVNGESFDSANLTMLTSEKLLSYIADWNLITSENEIF